MNYRRKIGIHFQNFFDRKDPVPKKDPPKEIESIFVLAQEKLGDAILLFPFLNHFHKMFPETKIDIGCTSYNRKIFEQISFVNKCISYRPINYDFINLIKKEKYTVFYNPKSGLSTTFQRIAKTIKADHKICLSNNDHNHLYSFHLANSKKKHILLKYCELIHFYSTNEKIKNWLPDHFYDKKNSIKLKNYVCLNLSSGSRKRRWKSDRWKVIVRYILNKSKKIQLAIFAQKKQNRLAKSIQKIDPERIHYPLNSPSIMEASKYIHKSKLLISLDTSLVHIAAAQQTPIVALYTNDESNYIRYAPFSERKKDIISNTSLIEDIDPHEVIHAVDTLLFN